MPIDIYWRRGCGACSSLRVGLAEAGVSATWHDIWEEPDAAAYVRSVARGNETVPTVRIGERALVAARTGAVLAELQRLDPDRVLTTSHWPPLRVIQWIGVIALIVGGELLSRSGRVGLSWLAYGAATAVYLGVRRLRARSSRHVPASIGSPSGASGVAPRNPGAR